MHTAIGTWLLISVQQQLSRLFRECNSNEMKEMREEYKEKLGYCCNACVFFSDMFCRTALEVEM